MRYYLLILLPVIVGVGVGYLLGGRLSMLAGRFRALWLIWLAVGVQLAQYYAGGVRHGVEDRLHIPMLGIIFVLGLSWIALNIRHWPSLMRVAAGVLLLGVLANGIVIAANGRMPYSPAAARAVGIPAGAENPKNEPATPDTRLAILGDTIPVPLLNKIVSGGDLLIGFGAALLLVVGMRREEDHVDELQPQESQGGES